MQFSTFFKFGVLILMVCAEPSTTGGCMAQDATEQDATAQDATAPPATGADAATHANQDNVLLPKIGPELLTMSPDDIEKAFKDSEIPEAIKMYLVIARGGQLDGRGGWFGPAQSRFSWQWLAQQCQVDPDDEMAGITLDQFKGDASVFQALDRDKDGRLTRWDLDWTSSNSWVQQSSMIRSIFRRMDTSSDFRLSREEWDAVFEKAAQGTEEARFEQIREAWISSSPPGFSPGDEPSKEVLVQGLFNSELGSLQEGPGIDEPAPLFELRTLAGDETVRLKDLIGTKPIVLTFGNFTCGPFRSLYTLVESVRERRADDAHFLLVYVREAHPTDGWVMASNEKLGVAV